MSANEYQRLTAITRLDTATPEYCVLGLLGEAGEVASMFAKNIRDNKQLDKSALTKELGDVMWFVSQIASDNNISLEFILEENINKLTSRMNRGTIKGSGDNR